MTTIFNQLPFDLSGTVDASADRSFESDNRSIADNRSMAAVYSRRRLVVGGAAALLVVIGLGLTRGGGGVVASSDLQMQASAVTSNVSSSKVVNEVATSEAVAVNEVVDSPPVAVDGVVAMSEAVAAVSGAVVVNEVAVSEAVAVNGVAAVSEAVVEKEVGNGPTGGVLVATVPEGAEFETAGSSAANQVNLSSIYVVQPGDTLWSIAITLAPDADPRQLVHRLTQQAGGAALQVGQRLNLAR